jgi:hypothetical protein
MDDAGVVARLMRPDIALALEHAHPCAGMASDQLARDGESDDPAADDG